MNGHELIAGLRQRGVSPTIDGEDLVLRGNRAALSPKVLAAVKAAKPALLAILQAEAAAPPRPAICPVAVAWDEARSFNLIRAAYADLGERVPGGTLAWCDEHAPALNDALDAAEADLDAAYDAGDPEGFTAALVAFSRATAALVRFLERVLTGYPIPDLLRNEKGE